MSGAETWQEQCPHQVVCGDADECRRKLEDEAARDRAFKAGAAGRRQGKVPESFRAVRGMLLRDLEAATDAMLNVDALARLAGVNQAFAEKAVVTLSAALAQLVTELEECLRKKGT